MLDSLLRMREDPERDHSQMRAAAAVLLAVTTLAHAADAPERVRISTIVTGADGRPVAGLTAKDFELREDGVPQQLISVEPRRAEPRRVAILLDEYHIDAVDTAAVRDAVSRFVADTLRPDDSVVVLKPLDPLTSIRLTTDRAPVQSAIAAFEGRKGQLEPRNALEEQALGRAPALVEAGRAQVVLSGLRALALQLGATPGRAVILFVTEGFVPPPRRMSVRGLPDSRVVERFANKYDAPIYAFDPGARGSEMDGDNPDEAVLDGLVRETGGTLSRGGDLGANLARAAADIDGGYTITYEPGRPDDGRYHRISIGLVRRQADARNRGGYVAAPSEEMRRAMREATEERPALPTRTLRRSPLIDVWSGVTRASASDGRVVVTWETVRARSGGQSSAARVQLTASTPDGRVLYEGMIAPVRIGGTPDPVTPDRAAFDAPPGRVQLDMTVLGIRGEKLDVDARDVEVPAVKENVPLLLPAILIATQSAREFREVTADAEAAPDPSREFRRTERLVIRVPAYTGAVPAPVAARLLNRLAQPMRDLDATPADNGVTQFDLPLAPLAPGEYFLQFIVNGPSGPVSQRIGFRITG